MLSIKVKWGKEMLQVDVDPALGLEIFGAQLQSLTNVPAQKQKVTVPGKGMLKTDDDMKNLRDGITVLLIGVAEPPPDAPKAAEESTAAEAAVASVATKKNIDEKLRSSQEIALWSGDSNGLRNIGNTCYLNSVVQTLRHIPELRVVLRPQSIASTVTALFSNPNPSAQPSRVSGPTVSAVERQLEMLLTRLDSDLRQAVVPSGFYTTFISNYPTFAQTDDRGYPMQQDAQEALSMILSEITRRIQQTPPNPQDPDMRKLLVGEFMATTLTSAPSSEGAAGNVPSTETIPFTILPCNINDEVQTLEAGLEKAMMEEVASEAGGGRIRQMRLHTLPEYLFVHFLRFTWRKDTKKKAKVLKPVSFPVSCLDVYSLCTPELQERMIPEREKVKKLRDDVIERRRKAREKTSFDEDPQSTKTGESDTENAKKPIEVGNKHGYYELFSVISHRGRDAEGGHYVSWVKKKGGADRNGNVWVVYDDDHVGMVSEEDVARLRGVGEAHIAYILAYRSRNPVTGNPPLPL